MAAAGDPLEAVQRFLPEGLLADLSIRIDALIALGVVLVPTIRQFAESMRRST